jgi:hypothetical protein
MIRLPGAFGLALAVCTQCASAQVIVFESNGLKYQTLTKSGVTIMYAHLPPRIHQYSILQAAVSNGSGGPYVVRPENFSYVRETSEVRAVPAKTVILMLAEKGNGSDAIKLVTAYENWISGIPNYHATTGFEFRRQSALGVGASRLRSAAAAGAIAFDYTKLAPAESTDGAVFFPSEGKPLAGGRLVVRTNTDEFQFTEE